MGTPATLEFSRVKGAFTRGPPPSGLHESVFHIPTKQRGIVLSLSQYFSRKKWEAKLKKTLLLHCGRTVVEPRVKIFFENLAMVEVICHSTPNVPEF